VQNSSVNLVCDGSADEVTETLDDNSHFFRSAIRPRAVVQRLSEPHDVVSLQRKVTRGAN
jgi:hypothetical protein